MGKNEKNLRRNNENIKTLYQLVAFHTEKIIQPETPRLPDVLFNREFSSRDVPGRGQVVD